MNKSSLPIWGTVSKITPSCSKHSHYTTIALVLLASPVIATAESISNGKHVTVPGTESSPWHVGERLFVGSVGQGWLTIKDGGQVFSIGDGILGYNADSTGTATVTGVGSLWETTGGLQVGQEGAGILNVENGGKVSNTVGYLGYYADSTGTATVTGTGSVWESSGDLHVGRDGTGTLTVEDGGQVSNAWGTLGLYSADSTGIATVTGTGSVWENRGNLRIGGDGKGTLNVENGGKVFSAQGSLGYGTLGIGTGTGTGTVTVTGKGSVWENSSDLLVGYYGTGTLTVEDGGKVSNADGSLGNGELSTGEVTVTGTDSVWESRGNLRIGGDGKGTLNVENGGKVFNSGAYLGFSENGTGTATVTGKGSVWESSGDLYVGRDGTGTLTVENGGQVSNAEGYLGRFSKSTSIATVTGAGSMWKNSDNLYVGREGTGTLNVESGGKVFNSGAYLGRESNSTGTATVTGTDSVWESSDSLYVGRDGTGMLTVENGGKVSSSEGSLGYGNLSIGTATVTGAGSVWESSGELLVGNAGMGTLTVQDGGHAKSHFTTLATNASGSGTLNLLGSASAGRGVLETGQLMKGDGTAVLNLNGGVLRTIRDENDFLQGFSTQELAAGGLHLDSNGFDVGVKTAFSGAGGLTKQGSGTLTLTGSQTYTGATHVEQGTLRAGAANILSAASDTDVAAGATLDLAGFGQTLGNVHNSGTVSLKGNTLASNVLTITGTWHGQGGTLALDTELRDDQSPTGKLLFNGPTARATGLTSIRITNTDAAGLGAQTTGKGIQIIATDNGALLETSSFTLAGGHVDAGAFEYYLYQDNQAAHLKTQAPSTLPPSPDPVPPPPGPGTAPEPEPVPEPSYRREASLLSALPAQLRQSDIAMLGDLRKRMGDEDKPPIASSTNHETLYRSWGRILRIDPTIHQQGTVTPESSGHMTGFQAGLDLYADQNIKAGLYVGLLKGDMNVKGFASGVQRKPVGYNNLRNRYLGVYGTWQDSSGLYADAVLQGANYRSVLHTSGSTNHSATTKGRGWLASLEMGKPFAISSKWLFEPQIQIIYRKLKLDDTQLGQTLVKNRTTDEWTLRLGARIKGSLTTDIGLVQPYGRINLYKTSHIRDVARFITPAATTDIQAKAGYTATELAAGASLQLSPKTILYGEVGKIWANGGDNRVKSGLQASMGMKVLW